MLGPTRWPALSSSPLRMMMIWCNHKISGVSPPSKGKNAKSLHTLAKCCWASGPLSCWVAMRPPLAPGTGQGAGCAGAAAAGLRKPDRPSGQGHQSSGCMKASMRALSAQDIMRTSWPSLCTASQAACLLLEPQRLQHAPPLWQRLLPLSQCAHASPPPAWGFM